MERNRLISLLALTLFVPAAAATVLTVIAAAWIIGLLSLLSAVLGFVAFKTW
jgi:hypothetical protein